jgi:hypothetical protein
METPLREANHGGIEDLRSPVLGRLYLGLGHENVKIE